MLDKNTGFIQSFTRDGKFVSKIAGANQGFYNPFGLGASKDALYVADTGIGRVVKYSPSGEKLAEWAKRGSGQGAVHEPSGISIDADGTVLIMDGGEGKLVRYSADGKFQSSTDVVGQGPARAIKLKDGSFLISDPYPARLLRFDAQGKFLGRYGDAGVEDGKFKLPTGLAIDKAGNVYVADTQNNRIQKIALE